MRPGMAYACLMRSEMRASRASGLCVNAAIQARSHAFPGGAASDLRLGNFSWSSPMSYDGFFSLTAGTGQSSEFVDPDGLNRPEGFVEICPLRHYPRTYPFHDGLW